jgi:TP901 family phage tail tape measure protein
MGDFKLKIDIAKPDVTAAERGLKSIFNQLDKIDKKSRSVDNRLSKFGSGGSKGRGGAKGGAAGKFGAGILGGLGIGTGAAATFTAIRALGSAISAAGDAAKRAAVDFAEFQNNIVSISRISGIAESDIAEMSSSFLKLSATIPVSATELQKFAETASRFGIKSSEGIQAFAETFGKLQSVIGPITEDTTKSVARIANLTDFPIDEIDKFANTVLILGKNFATTEDQIIRTAARVAGSTAAFGVTADEALGLAAALDSLNVNAELGGSALLRIFNALQDVSLKGGSNLEQLAVIAGMTTTSFEDLALVSPVKALQALAESGAESFEIMDKLNLSGVRVQDVLGKLTSRSEDFAKAMNLGSDSIKNSTELQADAERQADTLASRYTRLSNTVTAAFIGIGGEGNNAGEKMKDVTDTLLKMAQAFGGLDDESSKLFPKMASLGVTVRGAFSDGLDSITRIVGEFEDLGPLAEDIAIGFEAFVDVVADGVSGLIQMRDVLTEINKFVFGEDLKKGNLTGSYSDMRDFRHRMGGPNRLSGGRDARAGGTPLDTFGEALDFDTERFKEKFGVFDEIASKTLPGINSQLTKYKDKAADITFNNSLKGLDATEKRIKQLQRGFDERNDALQPKVEKAKDLIQENKEGKFIDPEELDNLRKIIEQSELLKKNFEGVKNALKIGIELDKITDAEKAIEKLILDSKSISKKIADVTAGPAPDVNAIQSIEQTASFIADSKRADKDATFQREQLIKQQELIDVAKRTEKAIINRAEIAIANFRNTP